MIRTIPASLACAFILTASAHTAHAEESITKQARVDESSSSARKAVELSVYAGGLFPASDHNFQDEAMAHQEIGTAPVLGLRAGYFPFRFIGAELEAGVGRTTSADDETLTLVSARAHVVLQLPYGRFTPFALAGAGRWWTRSSSLGNDADPVVHFGLGLKYALSERIGLRVDLRDSLSQATDTMEDESAHHPEILVGLSFNMRGQGKSPALVLSEPEREPEPAQVVAVPLDSDGDGVADTSDQCPQLAGIAPHGCPDQDNDGLIGAADKCPEHPETVNGFMDEDGCPDTKPAAVKQFEGAIEGITFRSGKAVIRRRSYPTLDGAIKVLEEYPSLRLRIHGHADSTGTAQANLTLSEKRAEAVADYFIAKGVDAARMETTGHGMTQAQSAETRAGRAQDRRIAFEIIR